MVGVNSITRNLIIPNVANPKKAHEVVVQADKNYGICDIILPGMPEKPVPPRDTSNGEAVRAYNQAKRQYLAELHTYKAQRSIALNLVQGRSIHDMDSLNALGRCLYRILN